jgi:hypothetical protein
VTWHLFKTEDFGGVRGGDGVVVVRKLSRTRVHGATMQLVARERG